MSGDYVSQPFLTDPPQASAIAATSDWVSGLLFGPLATSIAIIAIAAIGLAMLDGRVNVRRGIFAVIGCFLLFGAQAIADGLRSAGQSESSVIAKAEAPPQPVFAAPPPPNPGAYDPYAGASVTRLEPARKVVERYQRFVIQPSLSRRWRNAWPGMISLVRSISAQVRDIQVI